MRLHAWLGILLLIPLSLVAISGAGLSFAREIDRVLAPELWTVSPPRGAQPVPATRLVGVIEARLPGMRLERLELPGRLQDTAMASLVDQRGERRQVFLHPFLGTIVGERSASADPRNWLGSVHRSLGVGGAGRAVVTAASVGVLALFVFGWMGRRSRHADGAGRSHRRLVSLGGWLWSLCALTGVVAVAAGRSLSDTATHPATANGMAPASLSGVCEGQAIDTVWWRENGRIAVRCRAPGSIGPFGIGHEAGDGTSSGASGAEWLAAIHTGEVLGIGGRVLWFWGTLLLPVAMLIGLVAFRRHRWIDRSGNATTRGEAG